MPQLSSVYNLLSKPIYFHPAGMKPSLRPAELSQHPEKPLHFPHSHLPRSLQRGIPIVASVPAFDCRSDLFQWDGAKTQHPLTLTQVALVLSSFIVSSVPPLFQAAELVLGANCFSQHKSPQRKMGKKEMEKEGGKREPGRRVEQRFRTATTLTYAYFSTASYTNDSRWRVTCMQMGADNSC